MGVFIKALVPCSGFFKAPSMEMIEMKQIGVWVFVLAMTGCLFSGCAGKIPPYSGQGVGKWQVMLNQQIKYNFDFDRRYFESTYRCEIGCSGVINKWEVENGVLNGMTSCDSIYVTYEGTSDRDACKGIYQVYTRAGELLRKGAFTGQPL